LKSRSAPEPAPSPTLEEPEGDREFEDAAEQEVASTSGMRSEDEKGSEPESNSGRKSPPVMGRGQLVRGRRTVLE
jgi:hypothetical protein